MGTLNIGGSLGDKIHELEYYLAREKYDIVALSETGLDTNQRINVKGYTLHRGVLSARGNARKPRGVAFLVANYLATSVTKLEPTFTDQLWIRVNGSRGEKNMYMCSAYMPQPGVAKTQREEAYSALDHSTSLYLEKGAVALLGDFNARIGTGTSDEMSRIIGPRRACQGYVEWSLAA